MKRFHQFILEGQYSNDVSPAYTDYDESQDVKEYLKTHNVHIDTVIDALQICKSERKKRIYRGMGHGSMVSKSIFKIGNGENLKRVSANTENYYNLIVSQILPSWKPFPRRDKSFICTSNINQAEQYKNAYLCIPLENQKIGICSEQDFWISFPYLFSKKTFGNRLSLFNSYLNEISEKLGVSLPASISDPIKFIKKMERIYKILKTSKIRLRDEIHRKMKNLMLEYNNPMEFLSDIFDPNKNLFQLTNYEEYNILGEKEVWMSGKVLFIRDNNIDHTIDELLVEIRK